MLVHRIRTRHQAIMVGTHTAMWDNPTLTAREWPGNHPMRVTIDRHGTMPATLHLKDGSVPTRIYETGNLEEILSDLYESGIQSLLVEGGAALHRTFLEAGLWDEVRVEISPLVLGEGIPAASLSGAVLESEELFGANKVCLYRPKS